MTPPNDTQPRGQSGGSQSDKGQDALKEQEKEQVEEAERFPVERLIEESQGFLGVTSPVAAGAFAEDRRKHLTIDQAKSLVRDWKKGD